VPALIHSAGCKPPARESYSLHFILEETIAVTSLLSSEVFNDFPDLKLIVSHAGGAVPYQVGRFMADAARNPKAETYIDRMRRLWFDTCLYQRIRSSCSSRRSAPIVVCRSEKPGTGSVRNPENGRWFDDVRVLIDEIEWLTDEDRHAVFEGNARSLFRLSDGRS